MSVVIHVVSIVSFVDTQYCLDEPVRSRSSATEVGEFRVHRKIDIISRLCLFEVRFVSSNMEELCTHVSFSFGAGESLADKDVTRVSHFIIFVVFECRNGIV